YDAQKLRSTGRPRKSARSMHPPSSPGTWNTGASSSLAAGSTRTAHVEPSGVGRTLDESESVSSRTNVVRPATTRTTASATTARSHRRRGGASGEEGVDGNGREQER